MSSVKVAVRVRPFNKREKDRKAKLIIQMKDKATQIIAPNSGKKNTYNFDYSHWTHDPKDDHFVGQEQVYQDVGIELLDHSFEGYNCCIFAYGQTGSGKSYTMMGAPGPGNEGVIPRVCKELFRRIGANTDTAMSYSVEVSYLEIYNEKVRDLLNPKSTGNLRVREHPVLGPYVEDLTKLLVHDNDEIEALMNEGNKTRTVASTNMNNESSRSHAVFTMVFTQTESVNAELSSDKVSKISLVDLAGSERADSTGATGARLKEGANINKSLTTLGKVIAALAKASNAAASADTAPKKKGSKKGKDDSFIPYRDSALTWLLRENLGGNSRTCMIAALSPADINYDETLSTLRYADRAKQIVCKAIVNEDPNAKMIRELREEIMRLHSIIQTGAPAGGPVAGPAAAAGQGAGTSASEQLAENEQLMKELAESREDKEARSKHIQEEREAALKQMGIALKEDGGHLGVTQQKQPHLLNLNEDPLMSELLLYYLSTEGVTKVGRGGQDFEPDIKLSGDHIAEKHCTFEIKEDGKVLVTPLDGESFLNGNLITESTSVNGGARLIFGQFHVFRFVNPQEALKAREASKGEGGEQLDWAAAQREMVKQQALDDLKVDQAAAEETQLRLTELEDKMAAEKEEADRILEQQRAEFEERMKQIKVEAEAEAAAAAKDGEEPPMVLTPHERRSILKAYLHWRSYRNASLRAGLIAATPLIKEANAICTELNKNVMFQFICRTGGVYFPGESSETQIMVELSNRTTSDRIAVWPLTKLQERIYDMREFYHSNMSDKKLADPFSDRPPWFQTVGRAFIGLKALLYEIPIEHTLYVVNEQSAVVGSLRVSIMPGQTIKDVAKEDLPPGVFEEQHVSFSGVSLGPTLQMMEQRAAQVGDEDADGTLVAANTERQRLRDRLGQQYTFVVNVINATGVSPEFVDVFCQFRFQHHNEAAFSTESLQNTSGDLAFQHAQEVSVDVTGDFLDYAERGSIVFELFGHYEESDGDGNGGGPSVMGSPSAGLTSPPKTPVKAGKAQFEAQHDVLVWFEVCELVPSGEYAPVEVQMDKGVRYFTLQQGVQRRVRVIISHESGADLEWERVLDLAIGNVRPTFQLARDIVATPSLPLVILPGLSTQTVGDDRTFLHLEANWDSSRHDSLFLNRVTPSGEFVFVTLTCVIDIKGCKRPVVIKEHLCMKIQARATRSKGSFFGKLMSTKVADSDKVSHAYEIQLKTADQEAASNPSSAGKPVARVDSRVSGWRPRGFSLLSEHAVHLKQIRKLEAVEATKQHLQLAQAKALSFNNGDDVAVPHVTVDKSALVGKVVSLLFRPTDDDASPEQTEVGSPEKPKPGSAKKAKPVEQVLLVPELRKINPYEKIMQKGYLLFLETRFAGWIKRWAFISGPYLFVTDHEKDSVIRVVIRLSDITIQFNEDQGMMMGIKHLFTMCTKHRGFLVQTMKPQDMEMWLTHFDSLLAGTILSRMGLPATPGKR
jgi:kinesin family protein 1